MKAYKDLYKLEPGNYLLRIDPYDARVQPEDERNEFLRNLHEIQRELMCSGIDVRIVAAHKGTIEFIPNPKKKVR